MSSVYIRRKRPGYSASFSLFPFLAVLICTMGVLLLLLIAISRNIREITIAAEAENAASAPVFNPLFLGLPETATSNEIAEKLQFEADTYDWLTQEILVSKEVTVEQLHDARARVGAIENSIKRLLEEVERLHEAMKSLLENNHDPSEDLAKLQQLLNEKLKLREQAEEELKNLREKHADIQRSYAIVPYRGPNGTFRRPIYIECRANSVVLQPEEIVLQVDDFLTPEHRDNPMEMGVRTVRQYLVETQQLQRDTEPYPLFLVRPSGIYAYEAALRSLGSWKGDFGYELIEEDWNLEFHQPSEELKRRLEQQIQIARTRQVGYIQSAIAQGALSNRQQFRANSGGSLEQVGHTRSTPLSHALTSTAPPLLAGTPSQTAGGGQQTTGGGQQTTGGGQQTAGGGQQMADGGQQTTDGGQQAAAVNPPNRPFGISPTAGEPTAGPAPLTPSLTFEQLTRGPQNGRQKNWGLKNARPSAKSVERIVRITCDTDRYTIVKQTGIFQHRDIPFNGPFTESASDRLVKAIWDFMETWDSAGENNYWRPLLKVQVRPGAEAVFEQLKSDLADSGLGVERL